MAPQSLLARIQEFVDICTEWENTIDSKRYLNELGTFPRQKELFDYYVGSSGIDVKDIVPWCYNIINMTRLCGIKLFPLVSSGFTDIFIAGEREHNLQLAYQTLKGFNMFFPTFRYLAREEIVPIAVSYKHGVDEQLSLQRLYDGICALECFLTPGTRFMLWIDLVASRKNRRKPRGENASWLKRGLLPYQLFVVLCLDNVDSGRPREDYVNSFWLNVEGLLATLGSGMIIVGKNIKRNAVSSWMFEDERSDIPIRYAIQQDDFEVAFRPGNTMNCEDALEFLLQNAVKGAYDNMTVRYPEDVDDLVRMANCIFHCSSWNGFGKVAYDPDYSNYDTLFEMLSTDSDPNEPWRAVMHAARTFSSLHGSGKHTMFPTYVKSILDIEDDNTFDTSWLPKHCRFFHRKSSVKYVRDVWFHFRNGDRVVAVFALAVTVPKKWSMAVLLQIKLLQTEETSKLLVKKVVELWDSRVPSLLRDVVKALEGNGMNLPGARKLFIDCGIECPELTSFFASEKFEENRCDHPPSDDFNSFDNSKKVPEASSAWTRNEHAQQPSTFTKPTEQTITDGHRSNAFSGDDQQRQVSVPDDDSVNSSEEFPVRMTMSTETLEFLFKQFARIKVVDEANMEQGYD